MILWHSLVSKGMVEVWKTEIQRVMMNIYLEESAQRSAEEEEEEAWSPYPEFCIIFTSGFNEKLPNH